MLLCIRAANEAHSTDRVHTSIELADDYLLGAPVPKPAVIAALLAERSAAPAAAPFYRALEAIGVRAADEAIIALRLVLAGKSASDASVRRLRDLARVARAAAAGDRSGVAAAMAANPALPEGLSSAADLTDTRAAVKAAYLRELDA